MNTVKTLEFKNQLFNFGILFYICKCNIIRLWTGTTLNPVISGLIIRSVISFFDVAVVLCIRETVVPEESSDMAKTTATKFCFD